MPKPVTEWSCPETRYVREEIFTRYRPAVLRGLVSDWPAVQLALESPARFTDYLARLDGGQPVDAILMAPPESGRIAYNDAMDGFNFARNRLPVGAILEQLSRYAAFESPPSVAVQSAPLADCLPGFAAENVLDVVDPGVSPRIWIGNRVTVPAHFDESQNVACVVAGRRRFTLFPPDQVENLYVGPLDFAPTGAAMSLVDVAAPDMRRFPRFQQALDAALVAELGPGDAIFIPTLWWHHVQSLDAKLNVLVNYWWQGALDGAGRSPSGMDCLIHGLLNFGPMPPELRQAWASLFRFYVFRMSDDELAHIPENRRGILKAMTPDAARRVRDVLISRLKL